MTEPGSPHHHFETIGSTNAEARRLASEGAPDGTLVTSEEQTEGRGRQGRAWSTPAGAALAYSLLVRREIEVPGLLPIRAGVAVCEAVESFGVERAEIKWPNDVLIDGLKCAGILVEARPQEGWAVIGIGVNLSIERDEFPPELRDRATSVGNPATADSAIEALNESLGRWLDTALGQVRDAFAGRDYLAGREIGWESGSGTAAGIDHLGRLMIRQEGGAETALDAGEVHLNSTQGA
jgi:BirA family biotin operon repressor/biotin-[acetyl-CoA-carboxylase] ligase